MTKPSKEVKQARKEKLLEPSNQTLYRFFNAKNELLYVGITNNPFNRFSGHSKDKEWFKEITHSTLEHYPNRLAVDRAETMAIKSEKPKYNRAKNPDYESAVDHYRSLKGSIVANKPVKAGHEEVIKVANMIYKAVSTRGKIAGALLLAMRGRTENCELCQQLQKNKNYQTLAQKTNYDLKQQQGLT
jgi:predicted GIY-YIG superfamily endonuclease